MCLEAGAATVCYVIALLVIDIPHYCRQCILPSLSSLCKYHHYHALRQCLNNAGRRLFRVEDARVQRAGAPSNRSASYSYPEVQHF